MINFKPASEQPNIDLSQFTDGLTEQERTGYAAQEIDCWELSAQELDEIHERDGYFFPVNGDHTKLYHLYN